MAKSVAKSDPYVEIIRLAISKEVDAYNLYMQMAKKMNEPAIKNALEQLAAEELDHKARLELELMKLGITVPTEKEISELVSDDDEPQESVQQMSFKEMLIFAMEKERKAMRLYIQLATLTKDNASREMLSLLAEQEAMHQARFEVEYNFLMRKEQSE